MKTITFKCEVITPMFMAGADRNSVELRPSEFKGMMRFWWRAIRAENDIKKLIEEEAKIFGGTGEGEGRSKVKIKIDGHVPPIGNDIRNEIQNKDGCKYLFYSTFALRERGTPIIRKYIKTGYKFDITIQSMDEESYKKAISSFWLAVYFGGFGTRARRGGGNITITNVIGNTYGLNFIPNGNDLKDWILDNLKKIKEIIKPSQDFCYAYSNLSFLRALMSRREFDKWFDAVNDIGMIYRQFRFDSKKEIF